MTLSQLCKQVSREFEFKIPYLVVRDVMVMAVRVMLEELMTHPVDADIDITGFGRFYLNHRICHNNFASDDKDEYKTHWTFHFTPAKTIKDIVNNKRDIRTCTIAGRLPLYPEYMTNADGTIRSKGRKKTPYTEQKVYVITEKVYVNKKLQKKRILKYLPDKEEE